VFAPQTHCAATYWHLSRLLSVQKHAMVQCLAVCFSVHASISIRSDMAAFYARMRSIFQQKRPKYLQTRLLQCVAVCCSSLRCVAVCCSVSRCVAKLSFCVAVCRSVLQCVWSVCIGSVLTVSN